MTTNWLEWIMFLIMGGYIVGTAGVIIWWLIVGSENVSGNNEKNGKSDNQE